MIDPADITHPAEYRAVLDDLTKRLTDAIRELGMVRSAITLARRDTWVANPHLPVTERREECNAAIADLGAEAHNLEAEVDALRVERAYAMFLSER